MPKYKVELTERVYHDPMVIEAESEDDAERNARDAWENGEITTSESDLRFNVELIERSRHSKEVTDGQYVLR